MSFQPSRIIAGVMNWGSWGAQLDTSAMSTLISDCVDHSVTTFDHADIYGGHTTEADWGKAFVKSGISRSDIEIITKCGIMMPSDQRPGISDKHYDTSENHILNSVDQSLINLQTEYIDMLLIHRPSPLMDPSIIAEAFMKLKDSGKVRHFGVSNFTTSQVSLLETKFPIEANQIEISPFAVQSLIDGTLDQCIEKDIIPMAWSPLGGGKLFSSISEASSLTLRSRLLAVAKKYGWSLDEMIYIFLLHHPSQIHIVTGSSKIDRILTAKMTIGCPLTDAQWFEIYTAILGHKVA